MHPERIRRLRTTYAFLALATITLGLLSRRLPDSLPQWLSKDPGDTLYAVMIYWIARVRVPGVARSRCAAMSAAICLGIELAKFAHAPWLDSLRATSIGRLVLGVGFHVSNLVCYAVGVGLAFALDSMALAGRVDSG